MNKEIIFHQLFEKESSTYTYLLADPETREAVLIDSVVEMVDRDLKLIEDLNLKLKYVLDTHVHADHITASGEIRKRSGAKVGVSSAYDLNCPDLHIDDGQEIKFGSYQLTAIHTPGHTSGCMSYRLGNMIFTGDALLVRGCGRTDFQEGSSEKLFHSVRDRLFKLPDETVVYPAHDYKGFTKTSIGEEKRLNPRLKLDNSKEEFVNIMANLNLAYPKKIQEAVPANLHCGLPPTLNIPDNVGDVPLFTPEFLMKNLGHVEVIDVRGIDEFNNELGHIPNSSLITAGPDLEKKLNSENTNKEIVFVCRSGKRSGDVVKLAQSLGFKKVYNLQGGMIKWNEMHFPIEREMGGS